MKNLFLFFILWIVVACGSNSQKAKEDDSSSKEDRLVRKETVLPILDLQKEYPKKDIILQDLAEVEYVPLETNDSALLGNFPILLIGDTLITNDKSANILFLIKKGSFFARLIAKEQAEKSIQLSIWMLSVMQLPTKYLFWIDLLIVFKSMTRREGINGL